MSLLHIPYDTTGCNYSLNFQSLEIQELSEDSVSKLVATTFLVQISINRLISGKVKVGLGGKSESQISYMDCDCAIIPYHLD